MTDAALHQDSITRSARRRDHANFAPNSRERIAKFPKIFGTPRAEKLHKFGQRDCTNCRTSLQLFCESMCVLMQDNARVQRRDDANFAQKSREKFAKFSEIRHAPRIKKLRALGQRALHNSRNVAAALNEIQRLFKAEKVRVRRRDHANFALKSREKNCEIPGILAHRAHKICVHSANVGCAKPQNLVAALHRVGSALKGKKSIVTRRDHANLSAKIARNNCKFPGILARRAQRNCLNSASMRCVN